jgi:hypothetical protein
MRISRWRDVVGSDLCKYCQVFGSEYRRGVDWWIGFTNHLHKPLGTTRNYSAITDRLETAVCLFVYCIATGLYAKISSSLSLPLCVLCTEYLKWTPGGDVMPIRPYVSFAKLTRKLAKAVMLPNCIQKMTGTPTILTEFFFVLVDFLSPTRKFPGEYINLFNGRFLPLYFQFIIHCRPITPCCTVSDSDNVDNI